MKFSRNIIDHGFEYFTQILDYNEVTKEQIDLTDLGAVRDAVERMDRDGFEDEILDEIAECVIVINKAVN